MIQLDTIHNFDCRTEKDYTVTVTDIFLISKFN